MPDTIQQLPDSQARSLDIETPTEEELELICKLNFAEWGDALTLPQYLEESKFLTKVPLAQNGGMTSWILTDPDRLPNQRPILASCEIFKKRALMLNEEAQMSEKMIYGIASVFVDPKYRHRGYGTRLLYELAKMLPKMPSGPLHSIGSILYSDIGKDYYTKRGWPAIPENYHIEFNPGATPVSIQAAHLIRIEDLPQLCQDDEAMARRSMASLPPGKTRIMIVPDADHMLWHINKEVFTCQKVFGNVPQAKGAIAGDHGCRVWALWVHRYYSHPQSSPEMNTLYILRFVVEKSEPTLEQLKIQVQYLKAVLQVAQAEAAEWGLQCVKMWHPTPLVRQLVELSGLEYRLVEREEDSIASLRWFGSSGVRNDNMEWVACEKYAWV